MATMQPGQAHGWFMTSSPLPVLDLSWLFHLTAAYSKPSEGKTMANGRPAAARDECTQAGSGSSTLVTETGGKRSEGVSISPEAEQDVHVVSKKSTFTASCGNLEQHTQRAGATHSEAMNELWEDCSSDFGEIKRVFRRFDEDHDNFICAADLQRFMGRLGFDISEDEAVDMLQTVDKNGDGKVEFDEFCLLYQTLDDGRSASCSRLQELVDEEDDTLQEAFRVFDKNGDGFITADELQAVLLDLGMPEGKSLKNCERMIQGVDADGNGEIDLTEFKRMMRSNFFRE
ncbi:hypothetical protein Mapa_012068 [Marchantia paleacea]|nr:hypothetical protein Mapa_012068 [Marchantia paleacea]